MKKKSQKIIGAIIAGTIAAGITVPPFTKVQALSVDEIYANAYKATVNALTVRTQRAVNEARIAIAVIPKELHWAIGEFSKQVDVVQHQYFVKAYDAILKAQFLPNQASINFARASIDPDMPEYYRGSYSQAIDVIQQKLMKEAEAAVNRAIQTKYRADIEKAYLLLNEIKGATDTSIVNWAKSMEDYLTEKVCVPVLSVKYNSNIFVDLGTSISDIVLPKKITLKLKDNTEREVDVKWACSNYSKYTIGTYVFVGSYELPTGVSGNKPEAKVNVIVQSRGSGGTTPPSTSINVIDINNSELQEGLLGAYYVAVRLKSGLDYNKYSSKIKGTNTALKYDADVKAFFYENAYGNMPNSVVVVVTEIATGKYQEVTIRVKSAEPLSVVNLQNSIFVEPLVGTYAFKVVLKDGLDYNKYTAAIKGSNEDLSYDNYVKGFFYDSYDGNIPDSITVIVTEKLTGRTQEVKIERQLV